MSCVKEYHIENDICHDSRLQTFCDQQPSLLVNNVFCFQRMIDLLPNSDDLQRVWTTCWNNSTHYWTCSHTLVLMNFKISPPLKCFEEELMTSQRYCDCCHIGQKIKIDSLVHSSKPLFLNLLLNCLRNRGVVEKLILSLPTHFDDIHWIINAKRDHLCNDRGKHKH